MEDFPRDLLEFEARFSTEAACRNCRIGCAGGTAFVPTLRRAEELADLPSYYTPDWDAARSSVSALADLKPRTIAAGHGLPMCGDEVPSQIGRLAREFDHYVLPHSGKYEKSAHSF